MSKAYNCVEWCFIDVVLSKMGFSRSWVDRIMRFVTSVGYLMVVNGVVGEEFLPTHELR